MKKIEVSEMQGKLPKIDPPGDFSRVEKGRFRRLLAELAGRGIDPSTRSELVVEFVRQETQIAKLRMDFSAAEPAMRVPLARAVNVATAELRRLRKALNAGATPQDSVSMGITPPADTPADAAWRKYFKSLRGRKATAAEVAAPNSEEERIEAEFGPPSFEFLAEKYPETD